MTVNVEITELGNKFDYLGQQDVVFADQESRSRAALGRFLDVNENTFKGFVQAGRISPKIEMHLAKKLGFSKDWTEWKTGTIAEFKQRYEKEHRTGEDEDEEEDERPVSADDSLVVVEMFLEQSNKDSTLVFIELRCRDAVLGTDELTQSRRIAIQRGVLRLDCGANGHAASKMSEGGRERADWFAKSGKFILETGKDSKVTIRGTGSSREMIWSIEADAGHYLDNVELNEPHCHVVGLLEDDKLTATFETFPKNLAFVLIEEETGKQEVLTRNQQAIVDHMEKQALYRGQQKGSAIFSRHSRIFKGVATRK